MALDEGGWSTPRPGRFTPGKETRYPLYRRLGGPQGRSGWLRKISSPPGFDPRTVQPVVSRHTDYAIPAHHYLVIQYWNWHSVHQNITPYILCIRRFSPSNCALNFTSFHDSDTFLNSRQYIFVKAHLVNEKPIIATTIPYIPILPQYIMQFSPLSRSAVHSQI